MRRDQADPWQPTAGALERQGVGNAILHHSITPSSEPSASVLIGDGRCKLELRSEEKESARKAQHHRGRSRKAQLGFLPLAGGGGLGSLRGLGFGHALLEFVHAAGRVDELLL